MPQSLLPKVSSGKEEKGCSNGSRIAIAPESLSIRFGGIIPACPNTDSLSKL